MYARSRQATPLEPPAGQFLRTVSPGPSRRLGEQLRGLPSTSAFTSLGGATATSMPNAARPAKVAGSSETLEALHAQMQTVIIDVAKIRGRHEAQSSQTEAALVEVCKSLSMQQQQLEQQEQCTEMMHKLLQECLPGVGTSTGSNCLNKSKSPFGETLSLGEALSQVQIEEVSLRQEQMQDRSQTMETSLSAMQKRVANLERSLIAAASSGDSTIPATFTPSVRSSGMLLPELQDLSSKETMASLVATNCALDDLLADIAPTSAASTPVSNCRILHGDDTSTRSLVQLRAELQMLWKDGQESLGRTLHEHAGRLQREQDASLATMGVALREELGETVKSLMHGWQEMLQNQTQETGGALGTALQAQVRQASDNFQKEVDSLRHDITNVEQAFQKYSEATASNSEQHSEDWSRKLDDLRKELRESPAGDLQLKHKELCYLVHVQQNLLSQHSEELEVLRLEQHSGLTNLTSSMKQKLDAVSMLSEFLQHKVDTVCIQGALRHQVANSPALSAQPEPPDVVRILQQEFEVACQQASTAIPSSGWPLLQKQISALTDQVNGIDAWADHSGGATSSANAGIRQEGPSGAHLQGGEPDKATPLVRHAYDKVAADCLLSPELALFSSSRQDLQNLNGRRSCSASPSASPSGHDSGGGTAPEKAQVLIQKAFGVVCGQGNSSAGGSWKDLKDELCCDAEVLNSVCTEPSAFEPSSAPVAPTAATAPVEVAGLQAKLLDVLQSLQEVDKFFASDLVTTAAASGHAAPARVSQEAWWGELQDRHPDPTQLVQTQRSGLTSIARSEQRPGSPCSPQAPDGQNSPSQG